MNTYSIISLPTLILKVFILKKVKDCDTYCGFPDGPKLIFLEVVLL